MNGPGAGPQFGTPNSGGTGVPYTPGDAIAPGSGRGDSGPGSIHYFPLLQKGPFGQMPTPTNPDDSSFNKWKQTWKRDLAWTTPQLDEAIAKRLKGKLYKMTLEVYSSDYFKKD